MRSALMSWHHLPPLPSIPSYKFWFSSASKHPTIPSSYSSTTTTTKTSSMESTDQANITTHHKPSSISSTIILSPCAACKTLRRRCAEKCVLAPYFPPTDPLKFTIAHRVFGASNIIKFLQELPESQRADAVSSMVYESNARIRDPVYGCAGVICHLQRQLSDLQAELAKAQAQLLNVQTQKANLMAFLCMEIAQSPQPLENYYMSSSNIDFFEADSVWEPNLWT